MKKFITLAATAALLCALVLLPGAALARSNSASARADRNHDKLPDRWERAHHLSLRLAHQATRDQDHDGLNNLGELQSGTNPRDADSNNNGVNDANDDADHDGVDNRDECRGHTNPRDMDTDNDGVGDGNEITGTITAFTPDAASSSTGTVTITVGQRTLTGKITANTRVECRSSSTTTTTAAAARESETGDDNGGQAEPGDDNGGQAEPGDDNGGEHGDNRGPGHGDNRNACPAGTIKVGAVVREAELRDSTSSTGAEFEKIDIVV